MGIQPSQYPLVKLKIILFSSTLCGSTFWQTTNNVIFLLFIQRKKSFGINVHIICNFKETEMKMYIKYALVTEKLNNLLLLLFLYKLVGLIFYSQGNFCG